ncbi:MAG: hypothetical protein ACXVLQ_09465 [Bacteriovorax sp.]
MKLMICVFMGLILGTNVFAIDMSKVDLQSCEPIQRDEFVVRVIQQFPRAKKEVEFFIKGKSIGTDEVVCMPLKVGYQCEGNGLFNRDSFHGGESLIVSTKENSCYTY